jgi:hypothetical protein
MNDTHWEAITEHATAHLSAPGFETDEGNDEDGEEGFLFNPRAIIDLDW